MNTLNVSSWKQIRRILTLLAAIPMCASAETFILDTNLSEITISGTVLGGAILEQSPGSLSTHFSGTLQVATDGTTIQFMGQSAVSALNSGDWQPKADGSDGSEAANYGGKATVSLGSAKAAFRNILLDVTSPSTPLSNGQFDSRSLTFLFPNNSSGTLAYRASTFIGTLSGSEPLEGYATNRVTSMASLSTAGSQQVLTLPVDAQFGFKLLSDNDTIVNLKGQIVATRTPEAPLEIRSVDVHAQVITLDWTAEPNGQYQIRSSTNLTNWKTLPGSVTSTNTNYHWEGSATLPTEFFLISK